MSYAIVPIFFALLTALFAWLNIMSGAIVCAFALGFYLCLVADEAFTERIKKDKDSEPYTHQRYE